MSLRPSVSVFSLCILGFLPSLAKAQDLSASLDALKNPNDYIYHPAEDDLVKLGAPAIPPLIALLSDQGEDEDVRARSAETLGKIAHPADLIVPALTKALTDPDWTIRISAANALGALHQAAAPAAPALVNGVEDQHSGDAVFYALVKVGEPAVPALLDVFTRADSDKNFRILEIFEQMGSNAKAAIPALLRNLMANDYGVSGYRALASVATGSDAVSPTLIGYLKSKDPQARARAAKALGFLKSPGSQAVRALLNLCNDQIADVRSSAIESLGQIGEPKELIRPELIKHCTDVDLGVQKSAIEGLGNMGPEAIPALLAAYNDAHGDTEFSDRAIDSLIKIGAPAEPSLIGFLKDKDFSRVNTVINGIEEMDISSAPVAPVIELISNADPNIRDRAISLIGHFGERAAPAIPGLILALQDENWLNRDSAADSLGRLGSAASAAEPALLANLQANSGSEDTFVRASAADALAHIGVSDQGVPIVIQALDDLDERVRTNAALALGTVRSGASIDAVIKAAKNLGGDPRRCAVLALGKIGRQAQPAVPLLVRFLNDDSSQIRLTAVWALANIDQGSPMVKTALSKSRNDPNAEVRAMASWALDTINGS